jgi:carbonic anhydrase/acetyltransferase-like protein (isoleucine patch superfamily)
MAETMLPDNFLQGVPNVHPDAFVAPGAQLSGDVRLAAGVTIWYNCVLRADLNYIAVGENTNVQDGSILHVESSRPCLIADHVIVGHGAIVHACTVEQGCLIGMGAIILSGARIGRGSIVAAGSLIREHAVVEPFSLMAGVPARLVRKVSEETLKRHFDIALKYAEAGRRHRERI